MFFVFLAFFGAILFFLFLVYEVLICEGEKLVQEQTLEGSIVKSENGWYREMDKRFTLVHPSKIPVVFGSIFV